MHIYYHLSREYDLSTLGSLGRASPNPNPTALQAQDEGCFT